MAARPSLDRAEADDGAGYRAMAEINVTPMVDVMLVLLVIFMVTAPLMTVGVPLKLPKTAAARLGSVQQPIVLSLDASQSVFLRNDPVADDDIGRRLAEATGGDRDRLIFLRADRSVRYDRVMNVLGRISTAGFSRVSLLAEAPGP
ncbi:ExbD/TolR family protein [Labrys wisconsinensis]|uniref:Biopolymer transport protein TolR n=1 Tax=Labrys wisconsinensis TaxID=425677 RepID=A0ABU0JCG2_9HYPH|nr:biopolymer transporter ExbD [Labrys wisconsinensis]MDQ0471968.1 biopolymer transport protein TolR [Labrys wisconsinensis]